MHGVRVANSSRRVFDNTQIEMIIALIFCIVLATIAIIGLLVVRQNVILLLLALELLMLSIILGFLFTSIFFDDMILQLYSLLLFTLVVSESIIGLLLIVALHRNRPDSTLIPHFKKKFNFFKTSKLKITIEQQNFITVNNYTLDYIDYSCIN